MPGEEITVTGDMMFVAKWEPVSQTHRVSYDTDGGSAGPKSFELKEGETFTVASYDGTKAGYTFGGWSYNGQVYKAGDKITMGASDITLKAVWSGNAAPAMSTEMIIGIIVGVIAAVALIGGAVYFIRKK